MRKKGDASGPDGLVARFRGTAEITKLDLGQWVADPPMGPLTATLDVAGSKLSYFARGTVRGAGLPADGVDLEARASYGAEVVRIGDDVEHARREDRG